MSKFVAVAKVAVDEPKLPIPEGVVNRREFLYWLWIASGIVLIIVAMLLINWLLSNPLRFGVDLFRHDISQIPAPYADPLSVKEGRYWLSNTEAGLYALNPEKRRCYSVMWVDVEDDFVCPNSGAKFHRDGTYIQGPGRSNLDTYPIEVIRADGSHQTYAGQPANLDNAVEIIVNVRWIARGQLAR